MSPNFGIISKNPSQKHQNWENIREPAKPQIHIFIVNTNGNVNFNLICFWFPQF